MINLVPNNRNGGGEDQLADLNYLMIWRFTKYLPVLFIIHIAYYQMRLLLPNIGCI